eukprot:TRINITY_DN17623_c0_g1_i1.p1 TRINITY_DN17623_c0_g1~~TRINITY_DN17623_c0_g1_i1.p1  ORF type:complete len:304 (-),score=30.33 TRINITY_DN17623_c0_g1_i1:60-971(-)
MSMMTWLITGLLFMFRSVVGRFHPVANRHVVYDSNDVKVIAIPVLSDNYSYLLIDKNKKISAAIDPVNVSAVIDAATDADVRISAVLTTHHHADHAGGNKEIKWRLPEVDLYGSRTDREKMLGETIPLDDGNKIEIGDIEVTAVLAPCHTKGHVLFLVSQPEPLLFTGDTLFVGGCGKFFEGTAQDMFRALRLIDNLPSNTKLFVGHEYTVNNLLFAKSVEPSNDHVDRKLKWATDRIDSKLPTVPSTVEEELLYNPFMRCKDAASLATMREQKNDWSPPKEKTSLFGSLSRFVSKSMDKKGL